MNDAHSALPVADDDWSKDLNYQQEQFVLEYEALGFKHAGKAAKRAGYAASENQGPRLLTRAHVRAAVDYRRELFYRSKHLGRNAILYELAAVAGFDLGKFMSGGELDLNKIKGEATRALKSVESTTTTDKDDRTTSKIKVTTHDKLAALRLLMQHLGMIQEGAVNLQVNLDFGERLAARRARIVNAAEVEEPLTEDLLRLK